MLSDSQYCQITVYRLRWNYCLGFAHITVKTVMNGFSVMSPEILSPSPFFLTIASNCSIMYLAVQRFSLVAVKSKKQVMPNEPAVLPIRWWVPWVRDQPTKDICIWQETSEKSTTKQALNKTNQSTLRCRHHCYGELSLLNNLSFMFPRYFRDKCLLYWFSCSRPSWHWWTSKSICYLILKSEWYLNYRDRLDVPLLNMVARFFDQKWFTSY